MIKKNKSWSILFSKRIQFTNLPQGSSGTSTEELRNLLRGPREPSKWSSGTFSEGRWNCGWNTNWVPGSRAAHEPNSQCSPRVESVFKWIMWRCMSYSWTPTLAKTLNVPKNIFRTTKEKRIPPNIKKKNHKIQLWQCALCTDVIWGPALPLICLLITQILFNFFNMSPKQI